MLQYIMRGEWTGAAGLYVVVYSMTVEHHIADDIAIASFIAIYVAVG